MPRLRHLQFKSLNERTIQTLKPLLTKWGLSVIVYEETAGILIPVPLQSVSQPKLPNPPLLPLSFPLWSVTQNARSSWSDGPVGPCPAAACGRRRQGLLESKTKKLRLDGNMRIPFRLIETLQTSLVRGFGCCPRQKKKKTSLHQKWWQRPKIKTFFWEFMRNMDFLKTNKHFFFTHLHHLLFEE